MSIVCRIDLGLAIGKAFLAALQSAASFRLEAGQLLVNDINSLVPVDFVA